MKKSKVLFPTLSIIFLILISQTGLVMAQDSLLEELQKDVQPIENIALGTFKGTRLINGHSIMTRGAGNLDFMISHRFGRLNSGAYNFFGMDEANIRLGLEYAFTDRMTIGIGRNSFQKVYDGFFKYNFLRQQSGNKQIPVSMTWYSNMAVNTFKRPELPLNFQRRLSYAHQILMARKFSKNLSLQLMPSYVHQNLVPSNKDKNDLFAIGFGGSLKLTKRTSLNLEYYYRTNPNENDGLYDVVAIGFDIETGGHVFQLHLTNAQAMTETGFVPGTKGDFWDGDIHFGFNISRSFQLKDKSKSW